jgi:hypothetical protein
VRPQGPCAIGIEDDVTVRCSACRDRGRPIPPAVAHVGVVDGRRRAWRLLRVPNLDGTGRAAEEPIDGRGAELVCRSCGRRTRIAKARLFALAGSAGPAREAFV